MTKSLFDSCHRADEAGCGAESPSPGYEDCNTLLFSAGGSAVFEIQNSGVDLNKLVIGKPGIPADESNGGDDADAVEGEEDAESESEDMIMTFPLPTMTRTSVSVLLYVHIYTHFLFLFPLFRVRAVMFSRTRTISITCRRQNT